MIFLEDAQYRALKMEAMSAGRSMADLMREALSSYLMQRRGRQRALSFIGMISGPGDKASECVDDVIAESLRDSG